MSIRTWKDKIDNFSIKARIQIRNHSLKIFAVFPRVISLYRISSIRKFFEMKLILAFFLGVAPFVVSLPSDRSPIEKQSIPPGFEMLGHYGTDFATRKTYYVSNFAVGLKVDHLTHSFFQINFSTGQLKPFSRNLHR